MMKIFRVIAIGLMLAAPVQAQDFDAGDYIEAVSSFRMAAEQGHVTAQVGLGFMYFDGLYVLQDYIEAAHWYRMAAEQGDTTAQSLLGEMYEYGQGVPQDYAEAAHWYRMAAEQGHAGGQINLGVLYDRGEGVEQDNVSAHMWYNISAANGNATGAKLRDFVAKELTPDQIAEAQRRARACMASNYQDCD